ncbi:starch-binding protein [Bacteroidia bacterium]|nr:starch-binding protein [Bacteroidia bacterium]
MKNLKYFLTIPFFALLFSCADEFLDTSSRSVHATAYVFSTLPYTETAINGLYAQMTDTYIYGQKITTNWPKNSDIEHSSMATDTPNDPLRDGECHYYASDMNSGNNWNALYRLAQLASIAVEGIRNSPLLETADSLTMKAYFGEALTARALAYFELVKIFGDVPFDPQSSQTDLSNVYIGRVEQDTIYKYIIEDLLEAQNYVPYQGGSVGSISYSTPERINKAFIKGLTARIALFAGGWAIRSGNLFPNMDHEKNPEISEMNGYYVGRTKNWKHYYDIAAQQCAEIIGNSANPHHLTPVYEEYWKAINGLRFSPSNESLFEIAFGVGNSGDIGSLIGRSLAANSKQYGGRGTGGGNVKSSAYFFYSFDPQDQRRDVTVSTIGYSANDNETFGSDPTASWNFVKWSVYWMTDEYVTLYRNAENRIGTGINWIVMRYPDILLMFAEAQNELQGADKINETAGISARVALEKVRERAFGAGNSKITQYDSNLFEAIVNERAWEFGGEALRKYDLIRWGLLSKKIEQEKEALCKMLNGKGQIRIFDKIYQGEDFPDVVYFKYLPGNVFIDRSSITYYTRYAGAPDASYTGSANWLNGGAVRGSNMATWISRILASSTGLNASYDYSALVQQLDSAESVQKRLTETFGKLGNSVCNYRHPFPIYYKNITDSHGHLTNLYGY